MSQKSIELSAQQEDSITENSINLRIQSLEEQQYFCKFIFFQNTVVKLLKYQVFKIQYRFYIEIGFTFKTFALWIYSAFLRWKKLSSERLSVSRVNRNLTRNRSSFHTAEQYCTRIRISEAAIPQFYPPLCLALLLSRRSPPPPDLLLSPVGLLLCSGCDSVPLSVAVAEPRR